MNEDNGHNFNLLAAKIKELGYKLGFNQIGITNLDLSFAAKHFKEWLNSGFAGEMNYFNKHLECYLHPDELLSEATRVISCSISYPKPTNINHPVSSFALIEDYSKHIRNLLSSYIKTIVSEIELPIKWRLFAGNAPILEKALAVKAGLGWYGKNSLLLNQLQGSYLFLGEILINLPLPIDTPIKNRCGSCTKCITACPTQAIISPYRIDARKCISYLTIEHKGTIPVDIRPLIGNKIFGCDICQQACPYNKKLSGAYNIFRSNQFGEPDLIKWFLWPEEVFKKMTAGSPIARISYEQWLRNLAVALGNGLYNEEVNKEVLAALKLIFYHNSLLVKDHIKWAISKLSNLKI